MSQTTKITRLSLLLLFVVVAVFLIVRLVFTSSTSIVLSGEVNPLATRVIVADEIIVINRQIDGSFVYDYTGLVGGKQATISGPTIPTTVIDFSLKPFSSDDQNVVVKSLEDIEVAQGILVASEDTILTAKLFGFLQNWIVISSTQNDKPGVVFYSTYSYTNGGWVLLEKDNKIDAFSFLYESAPDELKDYLLREAND